MKPSDKCKQSGFKGLADFNRDLPEVEKGVLIAWFRTKPKLIDVMLVGAYVLRHHKRLANKILKGK